MKFHLAQGRHGFGQAVDDDVTQANGAGVGEVNQACGRLDFAERPAVLAGDLLQQWRYPGTGEPV